MTSPGGGPFSVLVVCTGNICRSPQAAQLLQAEVDKAGEPWRSVVVLASAGTRALEGHPMDDHAAALSRDLGADVADHRARQLTAAMVEAADLVLCMAREHRSEVVRTSPRSSRRVFLLTELADLLEGALSAPPVAAPAAASSTGPEVGRTRSSSAELTQQLRQTVELAAAQRGMVERRDPETVDVADPYRREPEVYRTSAEQIRREVERIRQALPILIGEVSR